MHTFIHNIIHTYIHTYIHTDFLNVCHEHLTRMGITHVLNVSMDKYSTPESLKLTYLHIPHQDIASEVLNISKAIEFIHKAYDRVKRQHRQQHQQVKVKVLVFCTAGVSRSAAMVIAYVMHIRKLTFQQALGK